MADNNKVLEIIQKIMTDPRFVNVVSEILDEITHVAQPAQKPARAARTQKPEKKPRAPVDFTASTDAALRAVYTYRKKHNKPIEPELNHELSVRFVWYDANTQTFTGRGRHKKSATATKVKKQRIINWAEKTDDILRQAYKHRKTTTDGIDDALNAELARRFPDQYDATTRSFLPTHKKVHDFQTKDVKKSAMPAARTASAATTPSVTPEPVKPAPATTTAPEKLTVTLKPVRQSLEATYNNVYVNGKLILRNHANTELQLLGDGTLLSVHGIVTDNRNLPQRPLFLIYDTNLVANRWAGRDKIAGYNIYAKYITTSADGINGVLSNKCTIMLNTEKLKRLAGITRFEIER